MRPDREQGLGRPGRVVAALRGNGLDRVIHRRELVRSWMLLVALPLVLATLWLPHPASFSRERVLPVVAALALTCVASLVPSWQPVLNRVGGLVVLGEIYLLVALTGGRDSIYVTMYLGLLIYAALFYGVIPLLTTLALVAVAVSLPRAHAGDFHTAPLSWEVSMVGMWTIVVLVVYALTAGLRRGATTDGLTGLANHATFWRMVGAEHERALRYGRRYSVALADVDNFKQVNDRHGHQVGDRVLREVAQVVWSRLRSADSVARYGGEEFAVLLPETGPTDAFAVAEGLRRAVAEAGISPPITISVGVASLEDLPDATSADAVVQAADRAMYAAKLAGRNRVHAATVNQTR